MYEATLTSKGQVTLPKAIRTRLHLQSGDRLRFVVEAGGSVRLLPATRDIGELRQLLPRATVKASAQQIRSAARQRAARRARP